VLIVYSDAHQAHQPAQEIYDGQYEPYAEVAARADNIIAALRAAQYGEVIEPEHHPLEHILAIHQPEYVDFIRQRSERLAADGVLYPSYFMSDTYAPITHGTYNASVTAADVALTGADRILTGEAEHIYALSRPPGHHAEHNKMGGYCYFNNAAVAAHYLSAKGRVVILDVDFHHGNGSQQAFYGRDDVLYVSLHADPAVRYPYSTGFEREKGDGKGEGFTKNYPLPLGTDDAAYLETLEKALADIREFAPDFLIVSCGFDTFEKDPIGGFALTVPVYEKIGGAIKQLDISTLIIQEGGYSVDDLGDMAVSFLKPFAAV
jgi:acetoin utilization deacetylase AcuC-like enzyme